MNTRRGFLKGALVAPTAVGLLRRLRGAPDDDDALTPPGFGPNEALFLQTRQFQRHEIAALFRVPGEGLGQ